MLSLLQEKEFEFSNSRIQLHVCTLYNQLPSDIKEYIQLY